MGKIRRWGEIPLLALLLTCRKGKGMGCILGVTRVSRVRGKHECKLPRDRARWHQYGEHGHSTAKQSGVNSGQGYRSWVMSGYGSWVSHPVDIAGPCEGKMGHQAASCYGLGRKRKRGGLGQARNRKGNGEKAMG
jgi:hypothetical protein